MKGKNFNMEVFNREFDQNKSPDEFADNGYGKRSSAYEYRITNRGGKGVKTINITEKTGDLISLKLSIT